MNIYIAIQHEIINLIYLFIYIYIYIYIYIDSLVYARVSGL